MLILVVFFNSQISGLVQENVKNTAYLQAENIDNFFNSTQQNLQNLSNLSHPDKFLAIREKFESGFVSDAEKEQYVQTTDLLYDKIADWTSSQSNINRVSVIDKDNIVALSSKKDLVGKISQLESEYIKRLKNGENIISRVYEDSYEGGKSSFIVASPILQDDQFKGFIMMSMNLNYIQSNLKNLRFFENGAVVVVDSEDKIAADNGFHNMSSPEYNALCSKIVRNGEGQGLFRFKYMRDDRIVCYYSMHSSEWKVISYIDPGVFKMSNGVIIAIVLLIGIVFLTLIIALRYTLVKIFNRPLDKLLSFMHEMNEGDYSTRIPYLGKNEFSEIATAFNNLMQRIQADNRELAIKEQRYRIANEQSNSIIFEFNVETGGLTCSPNACEFAAYPMFTHNFPESFVEHGVVHEDDAAAFMRLSHSMSHGRRHGAMEVRLQTYRGEYHWFGLSLTTITDVETFKPLRIIGKMNDIDEEKRLTENLTFKAERDPLTSVLNKAATQTLITQRISERKPDLYYAVMVLDIDCFKHVNDGYGHQKGDTVLVELANALMGHIRGDDVAGRVGGDEFMVLLTEMPSRESIAKKAESLLNAIRKIPLDEEKGIYISSSMGIAVCPQDGTNFNQLYASADNALYCCKKKGKNGFAFFNN